jgi:uncharacterized protein
MLEYWWLLLAASAFLVIHTTQFTASALRMRSHWREKRNRLQNRQLSLQRSSFVARLASQLGTVTESPTTNGWRILEVAEVVQESADCRSYYLVDPYGQPLPDFLPGQYIMVRPALAGAYQVTRCYSLSSSPDPRYWRITVKLQEVDESSVPSRSGGLSAWIHRTSGKGDCLLVGGPSGQFSLSPDSSNELVLIAAGVGVTPMASMLRWSLQFTPCRPVSLLYQVKDTEHWPLGRTLHQWQVSSPAMRAYSFFSRVAEEEILSEREKVPGGLYVGRLNGHIAHHLTQSEEAEFYLCGPDAWMEQIRGELQSAGVQPHRIHWESFGSVALTNHPTELSGVSRKVRFSLSQREAIWQDSELSLWEMARAIDVVLPSGCLNGVCGSCRVKLKEGTVEYDRKIGVELAQDECLACVARPTSDLVLEA